MTDPDTELAREIFKPYLIDDAEGCDDRLINRIAKALRSVRQEENEKHEALIGVLVGAILLAKESCERFDNERKINIGFGVTGGDIALRASKANLAVQEALSHPLVQEYLKKEKV